VKGQGLKMRILFCNYEYPPLGGGGGVANAALAEELANRHEVTVLTSRAFGLAAESVDNGVRIVRAPVMFRREMQAASFASMLTYLVSATWKGRALMRGERFDVINTHFALPTGPVGYALGRIGRTPNVLSVHGGDLYDPSKRSSAHRHALLRFCVRRLALAADEVVAQSRDTAANLQRFYAPEIEPAVIPLGIARPPAVHAMRLDYQFDERDTLLITVGRLIRRKAVDQLVDMLADLGDPGVKLIVVGAGPLEESLRQHARYRQVEAQVRFMGSVTDRQKAELLAIADVYVSTSQHEGFGLVFVEAMAAGLPIVCHADGGQNDFLQDGTTGYIVATNSRTVFLDRCASLVRDPNRRAAMGRENKRRAEELFIEHCARRYETLFESVLRKQNAPSEGATVDLQVSGSSKSNG
jgi:glycosyltransferase involved in cell wall biosynthesis